MTLNFTMAFDFPPMLSTVPTGTMIHHRNGQVLSVRLLESEAFRRRHSILEALLCQRLLCRSPPALPSNPPHNPS